MEATFVTSPSGSRFPRTPANVAAFEKGKGSNEKPKVKKEVVKVDLVNADVEELRKKLKMKIDDEVELRAEMKMYHEKMKEMQGHLEMMEGLVEDNERRFVAELNAEREQRNQVEARLDALDDGRVPSSADALKVRELALREKEFDLAEKKYTAHKAADDDDDNAIECGLSISDPSGDVLWDISRLRSLENTLRNEKISVTTVAGLLDYALLRNDELVQILGSVGKYSVRFVLQRFQSKLKSLYKISKATLSVVSILVMGRVNPVKTRAAIKYAGCRYKRELLREIPSVRKAGSVPVVDGSFKLQVLTDLPGIAELMSTTDRDGIESHWRAIEEFVVGAVGHIKDVKKKLNSAQADLDAFSGKAMTDADDMLADFNELFDVCTSWLGAEIEGDYKKIQRFMLKCPESVQAEYADHICSPKLDGSIIDELTMVWAEFESILQLVWNSSSFKANVRAGFGLKEERWQIVGQTDEQKRDARPAAAAAVVAAPTARAPIERAGRFKDIICTQCQKSFVPSAKQVEKLEMTQIPLPDRCPKCKGQVCDTFRDTGACPYGDTCKFLHSEKVAVDVPAVKPDVVKHSYSCRFHAVGKCLSGDNCKFQHDAKPGAVYSMIQAEPEVRHMDLEDSIQDTYNRFPSELVMLRPRRKVVTDMGDDGDE